RHRRRPKRLRRGLGELSGGHALAPGGRGRGRALRAPPRRPRHPVLPAPRRPGGGLGAQGRRGVAGRQADRRPPPLAPFRPRRSLRRPALAGCHSGAGLARRPADRPPPPARRRQPARRRLPLARRLRPAPVARRGRGPAGGRDADRGGRTATMKTIMATAEIEIPDPLPFLASISWFDRDYRNLAPLDMLRRYEAS